jgi:hypothetical protein
MLLLASRLLFIQAYNTRPFKYIKSICLKHSFKTFVYIRGVGGNISMALFCNSAFVSAKVFVIKNLWRRTQTLYNEYYIAE